MFTVSKIIAAVTAIVFALSSGVAANPVDSYTPALPAGMTVVEGPNPNYGLSIHYADSKYYVDVPTDILQKRATTCYGLQIGSGCCIGVWCARDAGANLDYPAIDARAPEAESDYPAINERADSGPAALPPMRYNVQVKEGYTVTSLTIHPDGTYDATVVGPNGLVERGPVCIGVRVGDCCLGLCIMY